MHYQALETLGKISFGVNGRKGIPAEIYYLQTRDFDENYMIKEGLTPVLARESKLEKHILNKGDVLITSKGTSFFAYMYEGEYQPAVASTVFLVVRLSSEAVLPGFLTWYINHPTTREFIESVSRGSSMQVIHTKTIKKLLIPLPPPEQQELILKSYRLHQRELKIREELSVLRKSLVQHQLFHTISSES
jgi:restriction endonuclease S subunit